MNNFLTALCVAGLAIFIYHANLDMECKKAKNRLESIIQEKTINIMHTCNIVSYRCVNSTLLYKEEMFELANAQLRDLGCR